jgi:hypothetical protein
MVSEKLICMQLDFVDFLMIPKATIANVLALIQVFLVSRLSKVRLTVRALHFPLPHHAATFVSSAASFLGMLHERLGLHGVESHNARSTACGFPAVASMSNVSTFKTSSRFLRDRNRRS